MVGGFGGFVLLARVFIREPETGVGEGGGGREEEKGRRRLGTFFGATGLRECLRWACFVCRRADGGLGSLVTKKPAQRPALHPFRRRTCRPHTQAGGTRTGSDHLRRCLFDKLGDFLAFFV
jgi:hypothetical protein